MGKVSKVVAKRISKSGDIITKNVAPLDVIREIVSYKKFMEEQKTERYKIKAEREKVITAIEAQKEVMLTYFNMRFKERKKTIDGLFKILDKGITSKDNELIDKALSGIVVIIKDNPLKDFETFQKQYQEGKIIEI